MLTYKNPAPIAFYSERFAPVPGWGMCPTLAGPGVIGIGAYQPRSSGMHASWVQPRHASYAPSPGGYGPSARHRLSGLGYDLVIKAPAPIGNQHVQIPVEDMAKAAVNAAWPTAQQKIEAEFPKLLSQAQAAVINDLWPKLQPKLRTEVDYALAKGQKTAALVGLAVVVAIAVSAMWVKKG
jgi:hypothetical protein